MSTTLTHTVKPWHGDTPRRITPDLFEFYKKRAHELRAEHYRNMWRALRPASPATIPVNLAFVCLFSLLGLVLSAIILPAVSPEMFSLAFQCPRLTLSRTGHRRPELHDAARRRSFSRGLAERTTSPRQRSLFLVHSFHGTTMAAQSNRCRDASRPYNHRGTIVVASAWLAFYVIAAVHHLMIFCN
jgi:hypothetical protein